MHYDKKISLALGILLVGIVGAFFFRNEKSQSADVPRLKDAKSLDEKIAQKSIRPYSAPSRLEGVIEEPSSQPHPPQVPRHSSALLYEELPAHAPIASTQRRSAADAQPRPKPIATPSGRQSAPGRALPIPRHNAQWTAVARRRGNVPTAGEPGQHYKVKQGDTLSALALRFLGSSARFREIFNANKNLLRNPDDLRPGITLRIPSRSRRLKTIPVKATRKKSLQSAKKKSADRSRPTGSAHGRSAVLPRGQFVPAGRSPVFQGRFLTRSSRNTQRTKHAATKKSRRRLEQKPPQGIPKVDDDARRTGD